MRRQHEAGEESIGRRERRSRPSVIMNGPSLPPDEVRSAPKNSKRRLAIANPRHGDRNNRRRENQLNSAGSA